MDDPFDKHRFAQQPKYHANAAKMAAREQVVAAYRRISGRQAIPPDYNYWTFCAKQPDTDGSEIVQLVNCGLLKKHQFFGVDSDLKNEGIIEFNRSQHPEANWFKGDWLDVIDEHYEQFRPALVYFDYTRAVVTTACHIYLARTMNMCPVGTVLAANLMISDGHSSRRFDPKTLVESLGVHLRSTHDWIVVDGYYPYKASRTEMATYIFARRK